MGVEETTTSDWPWSARRSPLNFIFERFWRGRGVETAGVGLGLAIVKKIVEAHRGTVAVRNNSGRGSIFALTFAPITPGGSFDQGEPASQSSDISFSRVC